MTRWRSICDNATCDIVLRTVNIRYRQQFCIPSINKNTRTFLYTCITSCYTFLLLRVEKCFFLSLDFSHKILSHSISCQALCFFPPNSLNTTRLYWRKSYVTDCFLLVLFVIFHRTQQFKSTQTSSIFLKKIV